MNTGLWILLDLVLLVPAPLVDLTLSEPRDFGDLVAGIFAPVRVSLELAHQELDLVAILPVSLPFVGLVLSGGRVENRLFHVRWGHHLNFCRLSLQQVFDVLMSTILADHVGHWLFVDVEIRLKDIDLGLSVTRIADVKLGGAQIVVLDGGLPFVLVSRRVVLLDFVLLKLRIQTSVLVTRVQLVSRLLSWKHASWYLNWRGLVLLLSRFCCI